MTAFTNDTTAARSEQGTIQRVAPARRPPVGAMAGEKAFQPVHVRPLMRPLSIPEVAAAARRNLLETIPAAAYARPMVSGQTIRRWHMAVSPTALRRVLLDNVKNYPKSTVTKRLLRPAVGASIFVAEGEDWRWQRRAAAPSFGHKALMSLAPLMTAAADRTADRMLAAVSAGFEGAGVACVMDEMVTATFDIVCETLLSGDEGLDRREVGRAIDRYVETIGRVSMLDLFEAPEWVPRPAELVNRGILDRSQRMVDALIAKRRAEHAGGGAGRADLLAHLLTAEDPETGRRMDDATLRNNLLSFIVAGHETTALALAWSLYLLANDPEAQDRAASEARAAVGSGPAEAAHLDQLGFIGQVIDEAMRLYPPAAMLSRRALADDMLDGVEVRADDTVVLPIYALHRHDLYWERPMAFDPENFAPAAVAARPRFSYLPFGAGPRICIGMSFALMEAKLVLATLLARLRFAPKPNRTPTPVLTMTLRPKGGMPLKLSRR